MNPTDVPSGRGVYTAPRTRTIVAALKHQEALVCASEAVACLQQRLTEPVVLRPVGSAEDLASELRDPRTWVVFDRGGVGAGGQ